jgi:hypothetical protein
MKIKVPYALNLLFPVIGWAGLCIAFAYILIITINNFADPLARQTFIIATPIYGLILCLLAVLRYTGVSFWSGKDIRLINKNISSKGVMQGLSTEEVKDTFNALIFVCKGSLINVLASGLSIVTLTILTDWYNGATIMDILIILCGTAIAMFFSCAFSTFFCQQSISSSVKECRRILMERGEKVISSSQLSGIGSKFYFLFFLPFFTVLIILIAVSPFNIDAAFICFIGLSMTFIIDRVLFIYLANTLKELNMFANELPMGEKAIFITGSLDKEIFDLSQRLNQASEKMYGSRSDLEKSQEEMGKRVNELEKFFELTVNREVKMVELKKELKKLKGDVQEDDA